jgi:hypothetical protein
VPSLQQAAQEMARCHASKAPIGGIRAPHAAASAAPAVPAASARATSWRRDQQGPRARCRWPLHHIPDLVSCAGHNARKHLRAAVAAPDLLGRAMKGRVATLATSIAKGAFADIDGVVDDVIVVARLMLLPANVVRRRLRRRPRAPARRRLRRRTVRRWPPCVKVRRWRPLRRLRLRRPRRWRRSWARGGRAHGVEDRRCLRPDWRRRLLLLRPWLRRPRQAAWLRSGRAPHRARTPGPLTMCWELRRRIGTRRGQRLLFPPIALRPKVGMIALVGTRLGTRLRGRNWRLRQRSGRSPDAGIRSLLGPGRRHNAAYLRPRDRIVALGHGLCAFNLGHLREMATVFGE